MTGEILFVNLGCNFPSLFFGRAAYLFGGEGMEKRKRMGDYARYRVHFIMEHENLL